MAGAMLLPAAYGARVADWESARLFVLSAGFTGFASAAMALVLASGQRDSTARSELRTLVVCWTLVPLFAAVPVWMRTPAIGTWGAWFEMAAAFTTTGGTVYLEPEKVPGAIHLWRGLVAWIGGLVTLTAAFSILAPRNMGGFEVIQASGRALATGGKFGVAIAAPDGAMAGLSDRMERSLRVILPVYLALSAILAVLLSGLGQDALSSAVHAMSIMSTSGISPHTTGLTAQGGFMVELVAFVFMIVAATRVTYAEARQFQGSRRRLHKDPELRLMVVLVVAATLALFLRHWFGALTIDLGEEPSEALPAVWGAAFTSLSFLTTTGFESASWHTARDWSGLANPGLILLGLCAIGGGAATTAGGIKLIRGYALMRHGYRELERIAQPNSVLATGNRLRGILGEGVFLAWAYVMLYTIAIFAALIALTVTGLSFQDSLVAAISAISNTGPAFALISPSELSFGRLTESQRAILVVAMIIGRIGTLALISLFNTDMWHQFSMRTKNHWK